MTAAGVVSVSVAVGVVHRSGVVGPIRVVVVVVLVLVVCRT